MSQLQRGLDSGEARILTRESESTVDREVVKTNGNDTGDLVVEILFDTPQRLLQFVKVAHVAWIGLCCVRVSKRWMPWADDVLEL